jgi:tetratricopeptide (TPR) repeat protein
MAGIDLDRVQDRVVSPWWHHVLSSAYHMLGEHELELEAARIPVQWYPDLLRLRAQEVIAAAALGDLDEVERIVEESQAVRPADDFCAGDVVLMAARELRAHGHHGESLALASLAVNWCRGRGVLEDQAVTMRAFLARALYQAERWDESRELFRELAAENPGNAEYHGYLGAIAARAGDATEAMAISDALPADVQSIFWRARIAALLGDEERAMTLLRQAFAQGSKFNLSVHRDMDLESLRDYPPFQELLRPKG